MANLNLILLFGVILLAANVANAATSCPDYYTVIDGKCFRFFGTKKQWSEAEAYCQGQGGHLACIANAAQNNVITSLTRCDGTTWIGFHDGSSEGTYKWLDGATFSDYTNWGSGQPDNAGGNEDCGDINFSGSGKWNDRPCSNVLPFVCQV